MGTWNITIVGHGCHHNSNPAIDADLATKEFVEKLLNQGHSISYAVFCVTSPEDLLPPAIAPGLSVGKEDLERHKKLLTDDANQKEGS